MASTNKCIESFWEWFLQHYPELEGDVSESLVNDLERHLFAIQRLDWEIGPGRNKSNFLALSPRGSREILQITRSVIRQAPDLGNWEFYPAKPRRSWDLIFSLMVNGGMVEVNANFWEFVAYKFSDGVCDLLFKPNQFNLPKEYLYWAANIIVDGELGEEERINSIANIDIIDDWSKKEAPLVRKLEVGLLWKLINERTSQP